ncbi:MAG: hypothetical protein WDM87_05490 [Terracidiphilus sp.]
MSGRPLPALCENRSLHAQSNFRLLIVRLGAMGDILHALPAVTALRLAHPDWQIGWVVEPRWQALLKAGTKTQVADRGKCGQARPQRCDAHSRPASLCSEPGVEAPSAER